MCPLTVKAATYRLALGSVALTDRNFEELLMKIDFRRKHVVPLV